MVAQIYVFIVKSRRIDIADGYMAFLPIAKTHPLCFWQFGFITVNLIKNENEK